MLVRKNILNVKNYQPGKPIEEVQRELGLKKVIKLASNENPLGPSPKALKALKEGLPELNRYPDSQGFYLKRKLAKCTGLKPLNFVLGNGSDELIDIIIKTFVDEDENIVTANVTFLEYEIIAQVNGRWVMKVPLRDFRYDLEGIKRRIDKKTKLVFIANPNNPTGTYVTRREIDSFIKYLPRNVLLVLDEAYDTFIDVKDFPDSLRYIKNENVIILKTFSKAYGLAGLRIGYAITSPTLASYMEKARQPFNVNLLAQKAAISALDDNTFLRKTRSTVLKGKRYIYRGLKELGLKYAPSVANFILVDVGRDGVRVFKDMLKSGVIVRDMKQYGLKNFIRVTIGTESENRKFITALRRVL